MAMTPKERAHLLGVLALSLASAKRDTKPGHEREVIVDFFERWLDRVASESL